MATLFQQPYPQQMQALLDEHMNWHMSSPDQGGRQIPKGQAGSGLEFLTFHTTYIAQFHSWYDMQQGNDQGLVAPYWSDVPQQLQDPQYGWNNTFASQRNNFINNPLAYPSADAFGIALENGIHDWIHGAVAAYTGDPNIGSPMTNAPVCSYFYQIHGLVQYWWTQWEIANAVAEQQHLQPANPTIAAVAQPQKSPSLTASGHRGRRRTH
ncbi:MAG TPA: hypothetical protein VKP04_03350 [Ktedonobacteraceae bacterium]|nr:hypothetical protein [Ktedonobacteraceae bacterium]